MKDPFPTQPIEFYRGKAVTVTGASGLIGSYVVKVLKESGARVIALVHDRRPNEYTLMADEVAECDLLDSVDLNNHPDRQIGFDDSARCAYPRKSKVDAVIGCAGITGGVALPSQDPVSYVGPATAMVINTLHACHLAKVERFGFLSSTTVYAPSELPVKEGAEGPLENLYELYSGIGQSKRFLEQLCAYYQRTTGIQCGVVRPSGAYGRFDQFGTNGHVLPSLIQRAMALKPGEDFILWGSGEDVRDFIHASDVARGLLLAVANAPASNPINIASGRGVTTRELAQTVLDAVGSDAKIVCDSSKPSALKTRLVDIEKARKLLGFEPQISLRDGIRDTVAWRRENA